MLLQTDMQWDHSQIQKYLRGSVLWPPSVCLTHSGFGKFGCDYQSGSTQSTSYLNQHLPESL